jgi:spore coat polysaccharide biosynthesis predicted glycosyltransferase SpsG
MDILIYTYGNHEMGMGHIYRMLNLASLLKERGHNISFLMPSWAEGVKKITECKWRTLEIPLDLFEGEQTYKRLLDDRIFDCIVVDALDVSKNIMKLFKENTKLLLSLDNIGDGRFLSDILINILYTCELKLKKPKIEINSLDYLILNENFKKFNLKEKIINEELRRILITQGGSDTYGVVPKIVGKLNTLSKELEYTILIGPAFKHHKELKFSVKESNLKINIMKNVKVLGELFYNMDLAISGGGMTLFELLCVGVPCITITQEYKELETIDYLDKLDLVENIGLYEDIQEENISNTINQLINNYNKRIKMSEKSKKTIDGGGCERTVDLIEDSLSRSG